MKEKIIYIVLAVLFIAVLIGISLGTGKKAEKTKVEAANSVIPVTSANFEQEVLNSDKRVLVDFYADWCGPCKILSPRVAEIANENKDIKVVKINVDQNEDLARKYNISSMPTLLVIENGKELNRAVGALSKSTVLKFVREAK
mgnify:FL=1